MYLFIFDLQKFKFDISDVNISWKLSNTYFRVFWVWCRVSKIKIIDILEEMIVSFLQCLLRTIASHKNVRRITSWLDRSPCIMQLMNTIKRINIFFLIFILIHKHGTDK